MKILFTTDQIYLNGGIEKVLSIKANFLIQEYGYNISIVTTEQKSNPPCYNLSDKIQLLDIGVNYKRNKSYFHPSNIAKTYKHYRRLKDVIKQLDPDVIIVINYSFDFFLMPFLKGKIPLIKEYHGSRFRYHDTRKTKNLYHQLRYKFNDYTEKRYDKIVVLNESEVGFFKSNNIIVIANPTNSTSHKAPLTNKKAIAMGRIAPVKGFEKLIDVWGKVVEKYPDWQLDIYGQDYNGTKNELIDKIKSLKLQNHIFFKGITKDSLSTMTNYSLYLMTSKTECFPMVLLESMSVGLPIISFDCPTGPRHMITPEVGLLVESSDINAFAAAVVKLIDQKSVRQKMGENCKVSVLQYSDHRIMSKWHQLFNSLVDV